VPPCDNKQKAPIDSLEQGKTRSTPTPLSVAQDMLNSEQGTFCGTGQKSEDRQWISCGKKRIPLRQRRLTRTMQTSPLFADQNNDREVKK
jgi:hypothetical protein